MSATCAAITSRAGNREEVTYIYPRIVSISYAREQSRGVGITQIKGKWSAEMGRPAFRATVSGGAR